MNIGFTEEYKIPHLKHIFTIFTFPIVYQYQTTDYQRQKQTVLFYGRNKKKNLQLSPKSRERMYVIWPNKIQDGQLNEVGVI
jgi:hypothetical protein